MKIEIQSSLGGVIELRENILALGPDVLTATYSFLSMTERSEYTTSDAEYSASLVAEENLAVGTPDEIQRNQSVLDAYLGAAAEETSMAHTDMANLVDSDG